jgi:hypothetical protein
MSLAKPAASWSHVTGKRQESDGTLALTKGRLTFAPTGTGVVFDADIDGFESAEISRERSGRSLRALNFLDGGRTTLWTSGDVALAVVDAVRSRS